MKRLRKKVRRWMMMLRDPLQLFFARLRTYSFRPFAHETFVRQMVIVDISLPGVGYGGLVDRLKGIASAFLYAQNTGREFRINHTQPYPLTDFLLPNIYDWRLRPGELSRNRFHTKYVSVYGHKFDGSHILLRRGVTKRQLHLRINIMYLRNINLFFGTKVTFQEVLGKLFRPTQEIQDIIAQHKQRLGSYIGVHFRFIGMLGDFQDFTRTETTAEKKRRLIGKTICVLRRIQRLYPNKNVLVVADSANFISIVSAMPGIYTLEGDVVHIDHHNTGSHEEYLKVFTDFFMLAGSEAIYAVTADNMYKGDFAHCAAAINNTPFARIEV